jgi:hypothetical protein
MVTAETVGFSYLRVISTVLSKTILRLVSFQTIWSIISDQCQIPTRAGLLLKTMVWYRHPWSFIRDHGLIILKI